MSHKFYKPAKSRLQRSELAVPGSSPKMFEKALNSNADYIFLDLEDAVSPNDKVQARANVIKALNEGQNVIFDIDWQGTEQIKNQKLNYNLVTFFILPPSKKELFNRLKNRDMKDKNIVEERMKQFNEDINHWVNYDCVVINDDLEKCYDEIINFINNKISKLDCSYDRTKIEKHLEKLRN